MGLSALLVSGPTVPGGVGIQQGTGSEPAAGQEEHFRAASHKHLASCTEGG